MPGFTALAKDQALNALAGVNPVDTWVWLSLHTADPGLNGVSELTTAGYVRQQTTWSAASASQMAGSQVTFNVAGGGTTITYWGIWTSQTSGGSNIYGFGEILPQSETYGSSGLYFLTVTLTATG